MNPYSNDEIVKWEGKPSFVLSYALLDAESYYDGRSGRISFFAICVILFVIAFYFLYKMLDDGYKRITFYAAFFISTIPDIIINLVELKTRYKITNRKIYQLDEAGSIKKSIDLDSVLDVYTIGDKDGIETAHISYKEKGSEEVLKYSIRKIPTDIKIKELLMKKN